MKKISRQMSTEGISRQTSTEEVSRRGTTERVCRKTMLTENSTQPHYTASRCTALQRATTRDKRQCYRKCTYAETPKHSATLLTQAQHAATEQYAPRCCTAYLQEVGDDGVGSHALHKVLLGCQEFGRPLLKPLAKPLAQAGQVGVAALEGVKGDLGGMAGQGRAGHAQGGGGGGGGKVGRRDDDGVIWKNNSVGSSTSVVTCSVGNMKEHE